MSRYKSTVISELARQQVRFAPQAVRSKQIELTERYLLTLDGSSEYSWGDVCFQVTGYRPDAQTETRISGDQLAHDLRCFVEDLSDSLNVCASDLDEPVFTIQQISERFNVSAKTVDRWRDRGLASRRIKVDGRKRVVVPESTLNRFVAANEEEIERGRSFRQMSEDEREQIVLEARGLAASGHGLTEVSRRLGQKLGRATETVRYTLRDYDKAHPENAIFPKSGSQMSPEHQALMYDLYQQGVAVADLARRFGRSKPAIHGVIADVRVRRLKTTPIDFMDSDEFRMEKAESIICGEPPEYDEQKGSVRVPSGLPAYLTELYKVPLLNKPQEQYYFRKMNFLRYQAAELQKTLQSGRASARVAKKMESLLNDADAIKNLLTRSNLRLVVSIAKAASEAGRQLLRTRQ